MSSQKLLCEDCGADLRDVGVYFQMWVNRKMVDGSFPEITGDDLECTEDTNIYCASCNTILTNDDVLTILSELGV